MKGMVFASGLGTRLRPLTNDIPKALVPVGGVPMLERVIRKMAAAGLGPIVVNAHYFAERVVEFVRSRDFGVEVSVSVEDGDSPLETGGGVRRAAPLLAGGRFLAHNSDILCDVDLRAFIACDDPSALACLHLTDRPADRMLLFVEDPMIATPAVSPSPPEWPVGPLRMVGWTNTLTGEVRSPFPDLDPAACIQLSYCGIQIASDRIFPLMEDWPDRFGIMEFYIDSCREHLIRGIVAPPMNLIDIGTPESLAKAERIFQK